jgi:CBS domain-containing protein
VIQLGDIMTTEVLTTSAERPVAEVTSMMVKARVGSAVVMQGSWLAGMLTERDVLRAATSGSDLTKSPVSDVDDEEPDNGHSRHDHRGGRRRDAHQRVSPPPRRGGPRTQGRGQHPRRLGLRHPPSLETPVDPVIRRCNGEMGGAGYSAGPVVKEAHALSAPVTAHAHGLPAVEQAVAAGADGIEHRSCLHPSGIRMFDGLLEGV